MHGESFGYTAYMYISSCSELWQAAASCAASCGQLQPIVASCRKLRQAVWQAATNYSWLRQAAASCSKPLLIPHLAVYCTSMSSHRAPLCLVFVFSFSSQAALASLSLYRVCIDVQKEASHYTMLWLHILHVFSAYRVSSVKISLYNMVLVLFSGYMFHLLLLMPAV